MKCLQSMSVDWRSEADICILQSSFHLGVVKVWVTLYVLSFTCSPYVLVGSHWLVWFPSTYEKHTIRCLGYSKLPLVV